MDFKNSKISDPHRLSPNVTDKIDLRRTDKYIALSNLSIYYTWKNIKKSKKNNKFVQYQLKHEMKNFSYLMDRILYQIFEIILNMY